MGYAQEGNESTKDLDIIMLVNDKVASGNVNKFQLIIKDFAGNSKIVESISYYPGKVTILQKDYEALKSDSIASITLLFSQFKYNYDKDKNTLYDYEIDFQKVWMTYPYVVIYIYNTEFKEYKKRYIPISKEKNYTYDYTTPGLSTIAPRRK